VTTSGDGQCTLFMYGANADALFAAVEHVLTQSSICADARVVKRYGRPGDPNAKQAEVRL
jgi:hypothetical protein